MKINAHVITICAIISFAAFIVCGCSESPSTGDGGRETLQSCLCPEAPGTRTLESSSVSADISNLSDGYIMIKYRGKSDRIKIQITGPRSDIYTYTSHPGDYRCFPLSEGSGTYRIDVLENTSGDMYFLLFSEEIQADIEDEFSPFLYPNQFVWFTSDSKAVSLARKLSDESANDIDFVEQVYNYTTANIKYDDRKAEEVTVDYIPDIDETVKSGKGICFDYASLMSAMLRSQGIPCKLVAGYSGTLYHAWISVYLKETGWVDNMIEFDGTSWSLMDPTLASSNSDDSVKKYIGDGSNYKPQFYY